MVVSTNKCCIHCLNVEVLTRTKKYSMNYNVTGTFDKRIMQSSRNTYYNVTGTFDKE
jgi:hypothetical protein